MFSAQSLKEANEELQQMNFKDFSRFDYDALIDYFKYSFFFLIDEKNNSIEPIKNQFQQIQIQVPVLFFYFIYDNDNNNNNKNNNKTISYLALYSNQIGIIFDLSLYFNEICNYNDNDNRKDTLSTIFDELFTGFCLVPLHKQDKNNLSYLIDLSNNYFLNSSYIKSAYDSESLQSYAIDTILLRIDQNCRNRKHSKDLNFKTMIKLIVYYVPLIGVITDDLCFSPSSGLYDSLPNLDRNQFEEILFINSNSFQTTNLCLHRSSFQFYCIDKMKEEYKSLLHIQKQLYQKLYHKCESSCIVPCYGVFESQSYRGYESQNGFLCKFICNGKITNKKSRNKDIAIKYWDNTTKSLNIYRLLISITFLHELGYYHRNVKPDHIFLDNENRAYFGGLSTICELSNKENESIGSDLYSSPEQYKRNISSAHSDVYSFGVNLHFIITGGLEYRSDKYIVNNEKIDALLKDCTNKYPEIRPDSFILFIQMHESKCFLPKTNLSLIDDIFRSTFITFLTTTFEDGIYLSKWSESLGNSNFSNLILKNLQLAFICAFAYTEIEAILNKILEGNKFLIDYQNTDVFQINFFAKELRNQKLKEKTDEMIKLMPNPYQIISKLILYTNLQNDGNDDENSILTEYYNKEVDEFANNFDDCILLSSSFQINPLFILEGIIKTKDLKLKNAHNTVLYILQMGKSATSVDVVINILSNFSDISDNDIRNLDSMYETDEFSKKFINQGTNNNSNLTSKFQDLVNKLEVSRKKLDNIVKEVEIDEKNSDSNMVEHNDLYEAITIIENEQEAIKLLKPSQNNNS